MKDNVITLNETTRCYVVDELVYKNKKYIFCFELDDKEEIDKESVHIFEVTIKDDELITKTIEDFETASVVNNLFLARATQE